MEKKEKILEFYSKLPSRIDKIRKKTGHALTLTEKILFSHVNDFKQGDYGKRGLDYAEFYPGRVIMQDATAQMALLQFMLTGKTNSSVPASVHCDHLITASVNSKTDLNKAVLSNREVYDFLHSACSKYGIDFWEPGSGIIHQIAIENYAYPGGLMIGTDSHTPTSGGLGMMAIGVGGADAVDVMAGMGWELRLPRITGIRLTGKLSGWVSAKDVILKITGMLSVKGGTGSVIEYFGPGAESLSATGKATICNMGAETGATTSIFGFDEEMQKYLRATNRDYIADAALKVQSDLIGDPEVYEDPEKYFDTFIEVDLSSLEPYINGPFTPDLSTPLSKMKEAVKANGWPEEVSAALIGSCTNSSYEDLSRAASVLKNGIDNKCISKSILRITPGSELVKEIAERDGLLQIMRDAGGEIFANACGPCIGQWERNDDAAGKTNTVIHSFNRNFARRTDGNPETHAFVASPELVAAISLAGRITFNPLTDELMNSDGKPVRLSEPRGSSLPPEGFPPLSHKKAKVVPAKKKFDSVIINTSSERLQLLKPFPAWDGRDFKQLQLLIKVRGKCTTDHISMAGKWLKYRGHLANISRNYMSGALNFFNDNPGMALNAINNKIEPVPDIAFKYRERNLSSIVVGEENFGEGSSREHAAMEPRFLNVKVLLVKSFARIHETNLKKQGILTITFSDKSDYNKIREDDNISITGLSDFMPGRQLKVTLHHKDGSVESFNADHSYNEQQILWFKAGSALNLIKSGLV